MSEIDLELLVLAALLHDIGKFCQRAGRAKSSNMEGEYCPTKDKRPTHLHVLYSDHFIENDLPLPGDFDRPKLARLASVHHKPAESDIMEKAIQLGDRLSSGTDRVRAPEESTEKYYDVPLRCIFSNVKLRNIPPEDCLNYPLERIDSGSFPSPDSKAGQAAYSKLFDSFIEELGAIPLDMGHRHYIAALESILERYMWCVPSSTWKDEPDISLFDHSVTTAAIAQALAVYHSDKGGLPGDNFSKVEKFILVGGDLSGIQKFIFDLDKSHGSGVAKLLRARSFYLQALTRSVIAALLERLGLMPQAKIMDAGGGFVLLLPAIDSVEKALEKFSVDLQNWFLKRHSGRLALHLNWGVKLKESDFHLENFWKKLDAVYDALEESKLKSFGKVFPEINNPVLGLDYSKYDLGPCQICATEPADPEPTERYGNDHDIDLGLCWNCWGLIEKVGKKLPRENTRFMVLGRDIPKPDLELFDGIRLVLAENVEPAHRDAMEIVGIKSRGPHAFQPIAGHIPTWSKADMERWKHEGRSSPDGEDTALDPGAPKTFSDLAQESRDFDPEMGLQGKALLGALKADVDNLGLVFSLGLDRRSISRTVSLSRMLNHFFAEHLVSVIEKDYPDIYVIFAGGDDLYLLGPWTLIVRFAAFMWREFARFTGGNPDVTISAGIAVTKPSLPVVSISSWAEELLGKSKNREKVKNAVTEKVKDAVTLFGVTVEWSEYERLLEQGDRFREKAIQGDLTMGVLGRLLAYGRSIRKFNKGEMREGITFSHMQYDFRRNLGDEALREEFSGMVHDREFLARLDLPLSYALYRIRKN